MKCPGAAQGLFAGEDLGSERRWGANRERQELKSMALMSTQWRSKDAGQRVGRDWLIEA